MATLEDKEFLNSISFKKLNLIPPIPLLIVADVVNLAATLCNELMDRQFSGAT